MLLQEHGNYYIVLVIRYMRLRSFRLWLKDDLLVIQLRPKSLISGVISFVPQDYAGCLLVV